MSDISDVDDIRDDILDAIDEVVGNDYEVDDDDYTVTMGDCTSHQLTFVLTFAEGTLASDTEWTPSRSPGWMDDDDDDDDDD